MKRPKQLLPWGDESLLRQACKTALQSVCHPVVVVLGCEFDACRQNMAGLAVITIDNPDWRSGIGSSIAAGVSELESIAPETSGVLILLVDQPMVTPALLNSLVASCSPPKSPICATSYGQSGGVPAVFDRTFFSELKALDPERGARDLIARNIGLATLVDANGVLVDLDTPEAYLKETSKL